MKSPRGLSETTMRRFSAWVAEHLGLNFPPEKYADLRRGVREACSELGFSDPEECLERLIAGLVTRELNEILASRLTVGETYFFREQNTFEALEKIVLPELVDKRASNGRHLRFWSAGCATGEEPYSLAILLHHLRASLTGWQVTIVATDINAAALKKAASGIYTEWSFRGTPSWVKDNYFVRHADGNYELVPEIRAMVSFGYLNLAEDVYPSLLNNTAALDVVLCRNVLMYFVPDIARKVLEKFSLSILPGGWLNVSPCDSFRVPKANFSLTEDSEVTFFRKKRTGEGLKATGEVFSDISVDVPPSLLPATSTPAQPTNNAIPSTTSLPKAAECLSQGRYGEAAELALAHLRAHPGNSAAFELLARSSANQGQLAQALQWCEQGLQAETLNTSLHFLRATILQEEGRVEDAIAALKRVIYLDPNFVLARFGLGNLCRQLGRSVEAQGHFNRALDLLERCAPEELLPESEGITAGRLRQIIRSTQLSELAA